MVNIRASTGPNRHKTMQQSSLDMQLSDRKRSCALAKPERLKGNVPESNAGEADESLGDVSVEVVDAAPSDPSLADNELADLAPADLPSITAEPSDEVDND